jgi:hypothetical protein
MAYAVARRGWKDYQARKGEVPVLKRAAWGFTRVAAAWVAGIAVLVLLVVAWVFGAVDAAPARACPSTAVAAATVAPAGSASSRSPSIAPTCPPH